MINMQLSRHLLLQGDSLSVKAQILSHLSKHLGYSPGNKGSVTLIKQISKSLFQV